MVERAEAIRARRRRSDQFVAGGLPFDQFYPALARQFACFDPLDGCTADLPADLRAEVVFYSDWPGGECGECGESSHLIPEATGWRYDETTEPYGWIDKDQYRHRVERGPRGLTRGDLGVGRPDDRTTGRPDDRTTGRRRPRGGTGPGRLTPRR